MKNILFVTVFVVFCVFLGSAEETVREKKDRSHLLLNYISPLALGIASALIVLVITVSVVICIFDLRGQSGLPKEAREGENLTWVPIISSNQHSHSDRKIREPLLQPASDETDTQKSEMKMHELEAEATQFSLIRGVSSRLDPQEKHARIIEAIYQASGRELPEMYRTKNHLKIGKSEDLDNLVNPLEAINEDAEEDGTGFEQTQPSDRKEVANDRKETPSDRKEPVLDAVKIQDLISDSKTDKATSKKGDTVSEKDSTTTKKDSVMEKKDRSKEEIKEEKKEEKKKGSKEEVKEDKKEEKKEGSKEEVKEEKEEEKKEEEKKTTEESPSSKKEEKKEENGNK